MIDKIEIKTYKRKYCLETLNLFRNTVHNINKTDYTKEELDAWAPLDIKEDVWHSSFDGNISVVALMNNKVIGFGDMKPSGYFNRLYVDYKHQKKSVATMIANYLESKVNEKIVIADVSITAKPFFRNRGYVVIKKQEVNRRGVTLINYKMTLSKDK